MCWSGAAWDRILDKNNPITDKELLDYFPKDCPQWGVGKLPWTDAMGAVFISGWFYIFFTLSGAPYARRLWQTDEQSRLQRADDQTA